MSLNKFLIFALLILSISSIRFSLKRNKTKKYYKICQKVNKTLSQIRDVQNALDEINQTIINKNDELTNNDEEILEAQKKIFAYYQNALNNIKYLVSGEDLMYKQDYYDSCLKKVQEIEDANKALDDVKNNTEMLQQALDNLISGDY